MSDAVQTIQNALLERFGERFKVDHALAGLDELARISARRVRRRYLDRDVPPDLLRLLCASALCAPSKSDLQQADILILREKAKRDDHRGLASGNAVAARGAGVSAVPRQRTPGAVRFAMARQAVSQRSPRPVLQRDGRRRDRDDHVHARGGCRGARLLPDQHDPQSCRRRQRVGRSAGEGRSDCRHDAWAGRRRRAGFRRGCPCRSRVHEERFDESDLAAKIDDYDRRRAAARPYRRQRDTARFGEAEFYGWSEDKARQYASPQRADFGAFVRRQGFHLD